MRFRLDVPGSPEEVFWRVADFARLGEWDPAVAEVSVTAGEPLQPGCELRLQASRLGGGFTLDYTLEEVDPPQRATYRGGTQRVTSVDTVDCTPVAGGTRVTIISKLFFSGWTRLIAPLVLAAVWAGGRVVSLPALRRHLST